MRELDRSLFSRWNPSLSDPPLDAQEVIAIELAAPSGRQRSPTQRQLRWIALISVSFLAFLQ